MHSWYEYPDIWGLVTALIISTVSGFISIARRILDGAPASCLWIISEFLTAILCGYLMYHVYPTIQSSLPEWFTLPVAIAIAAHIGGRVFQEAEAGLIGRYSSIKKYKF